MVIFQSFAITIAFFAILWVGACALGDALAYLATFLDRLEDGPTEPAVTTHDRTR